jgi:hypothetical protein
LGQIDDGKNLEEAQHHARSREASVIPPGWRGRVDGFRDLVLERER